MNIDQWIRQISEAYQSVDVPFSQYKRALLVAELSECSTHSQKKVLAETIDIITHFFFRKSSKGETFGSLDRIKERFGRSLEENYGIAKGPFINVAQTYWTYKLEVGDLFPENYNLALYQILEEVEIDIASVFFPTPGPMKIPIGQRKEAQRQLLQKYVPNMDIERFLSESPILKSEAGRIGCLGTVILTVLIPAALWEAISFLFA